MSSYACNICLALEIQQANTPAKVPCNCCFFKGHKCYIMLEGLSCLKCAKCTKASKLCVNISQLLLDKTYKEYKKKVEEDKTLLATIITQLLQNKKILKQVNDYAQQKALCIANKIVVTRELDTAKEVDYLVASIRIYTSPATQGVLSLIKKSVANYSTYILISSSL